MPFQKLLAFTKKVADFADKPSGTPAEIKAQFDAAPDEVRQSLNSLIDALKSTQADDSGAKNIGISSIAGLDGTDIQTALQNLFPVYGSNTAGSYIKFPDGTLICLRELTANTNGTSYYDGEHSFAFGFVGGTILPFISAYNNFSGRSEQNASQSYITPLNGSTFRWGVKFPGNLPSGYVVSVRIMAIGRWK